MTTTTPAKKHSTCRRRGLLGFGSSAQRKARRRRGRRALRYWQRLTRRLFAFHYRRWPFAESLPSRLRHGCAAALLALSLPAIAHAETFTVDSPADTTAANDGDLTLREAIELANANEGADTIEFTEELSGEVIVLKQGELAISDDLNIDASNLAQAPIIDAERQSRVMRFTAPDGDLSLTKLNLCNGWTDEDGAGVLFDSSGILSLNHSVLSGNSTSGYGYGGGICTWSGSVALTNSALRGNYSSGYGGGIYSETGAITFTNSVVRGNSAYYGGGGISSNVGPITLFNSTVSGNDYGGISSRQGRIDLTGSTVSGNRGGGGGILAGSGAVSLRNSTVSGNSDGNSGGVHAVSGSLTLTNSIIAGNSSNVFAQDVKAPDDPSTKLEVSYCLIGNSNGAGLADAKVNQNNLIDIDPLLEPLADNGAPTQTHALRIGSPAIDQGNATEPDQRGFPRADDPMVTNAAGGNGSDIGAFERAIYPDGQTPESWLISHAKRADADFLEDDNRDGVSLLMAYALGLDPNQNLSGRLPVPLAAEGTLGLSFYAGNPAIDYTVQTSTDLIHWTSEGVILSGLDADDQRTATVVRAETSRFLRLVVAPRGWGIRARSAHTIGFDDLRPGADVLSVDPSRYRGEGIVFDRWIPVYDVYALPSQFADPLRAGGGSPSTVLVLSDALNTGTSIGASFALPGTTTPALTDFVQVVFGDTNVGTTRGTIEAFDKAGNLIDSATTITPDSQAAVLEVSAPGIARVRISTDADGCVVDSIAFDPLRELILTEGWQRCRGKCDPGY